MRLGLKVIPEYGCSCPIERIGNWMITSQTDARISPIDRIFGTAAAVALAAAAGVSIVRVHDVAEMLEVVKIVNAITAIMR